MAKTMGQGDKNHDMNVIMTLLQVSKNDILFYPLTACVTHATHICVSLLLVLYYCNREQACFRSIHINALPYLVEIHFFCHLKHFIQFVQKFLLNWTLKILPSLSCELSCYALLLNQTPSGVA